MFCYSGVKYCIIVERWICMTNDDILPIQTLLGRSNVRTPMICTHCVPGRKVKEAKSPLDL